MIRDNSRKSNIITCVIFMIIAVLAVVLISSYEYHFYIKNYNEKLNTICNTIVEKYPEVKDDDLMEILNSNNADSNVDSNVNTDSYNDTNIDESFFEKYGIDIEKDSIIYSNESFYRKCLLVNSLAVILAGIIIMIFLYWRASNRRTELNRIADYLKNINQGNYKFDMNNSTEGDMSSLESEVFKTTIMLKEAADNSRLDKERLKDSLSDISHQLKTPLTSLLINLENLQDNPELDLASRNKLLANAKRDTNRISQMVKQLLTLSKLDANVIEFKKEKVRLADLVSESIQNVEALADLMGIKLMESSEQASTTDSQVLINCDKYWQQQAITNILKNAVEHAKSQVTIRYNNCELYREIIIENDGEPISEIDRKNIFKRFYSGENTSKDSIGIGLSLANAVVKNDGGYIVVESDETTRFRLRY